MVSYRTNGDYVSAVLKTQILFQPLSKHHANKKGIVSHSPNRDHAPVVVMTSFQQEDYCFLEY